jgi:organic hydroperoxide reductase OsmC/OhrA
MSSHRATVVWRREGDFARKKYHRQHVWRFDGGIEVPASASPLVVPQPWSTETAVDPEEAFVASISSCHMLTFLFLAANEGLVAESYEDEAEGHLTKGNDGQQWVETVTLRPRIVWAAEKGPAAQQLASLHHQAHAECFIARSVRTIITVEDRSPSQTEASVASPKVT